MIAFYSKLVALLELSESKLADKIKQKIDQQPAVAVFSFGLLFIDLELFFISLVKNLARFFVVLFVDSSYGFKAVFKQQELNICPFSYLAYKKTQSKVRLFSIASLATIIAVAITTSLITNLIFGGKAPTFAASFGWTQASWLDGANDTVLANHNDDRTLWEYFASSSLVRILTNGTLTLATTTITTTANFASNTGSNTYLLNGFPTQKKLDNARCATTTECSNGACTEDFNNIAQKYCHTNANKCIDWVDNASSTEFNSTSTHCFAHSYSKVCNSGTWGATTTPTPASVCTPTSGANNGLANGGWLASSTTCNEGTGFPATSCTSCNAGYGASIGNNGCYTSCSVDSSCATGYACGSGACMIACNGSSTVGSICAFGGLVYGVVNGASGMLWLDRNLGATRVAQSSTDTQSYGWYYQWGRGTDGHQISTSSLTTIQSDTANPGHSNFITFTGGNYDWRTATDNTLWQGAVNNPCPPGFRLPSQPEWSTLVSGLSITNSATAYSSTLRLSLTGYRIGGTLYSQGSTGYYWSSTPLGNQASYLGFSSSVGAYGYNRTYGVGVRCIKN